MGNRVFQVSVDTILITLIAENESVIFDYLVQSDSSFFEENGEIFIDFGDDCHEKCEITDVTDKLGVIQYESH